MRKLERCGVICALHSVVVLVVFSFINFCVQFLVSSTTSFLEKLHVVILYVLDCNGCIVYILFFVVSAVIAAD